MLDSFPTTMILTWHYILSHSQLYLSSLLWSIYSPLHLLLISHICLFSQRPFLCPEVLISIFCLEIFGQQVFIKANHQVREDECFQTIIPVISHRNNNIEIQSVLSSLFFLQSTFIQLIQRQSSWSVQKVTH